MTQEELRLVIATHEGRHHADEVMACWFYHVLYEGNIHIVRTSDPRLIEHADVCLDCGGEYLPGRGRIDHHGNDTRAPAPYEDRGSQYATAGLVWNLYGPKICEILLDDMKDGPWPSFRSRKSDLELHTLYFQFSRILDQEILAPIDAWDVGVYPDRMLTRHFLPFQWILPHLEFDVAMMALGRAFLQRLRSLADAEAGEDTLEIDLMQNGPCEFWVFKSWVVVKAPPQKRVELKAAKRFAGRVLRAPLLGVLSTLRGGTRWGAFLTTPLPACIEIPGDLEYAAGRRSVFHDDPTRLLHFLRACAEEKSLHVPFGPVKSDA